MNIPCPDEERLTDYMECRLSETETQIMERHLLDCERCLEMVVLGKRIFNQENGVALESAPIQITQQAIHQIPAHRKPIYQNLMEKLSDMWETISDRWAEFWQPMQPAMVRGSNTRPDGLPIHLRFETIEAVLDIEKTLKQSAYIRITLANVIPKGDIRITLMKEDRELCSLRPADPHAVFEDIPFGTYSLVVSQNGVEIGRYSFNVA